MLVISQPRKVCNGGGRKGFLLASPPRQQPALNSPPGTPSSPGNAGRLHCLVESLHHTSQEYVTQNSLINLCCTSS